MIAKWMCRNSFAEAFRPYMQKAWCGKQTMSDLKEALADCVCYYFESEGKRVLSLAVRMWPTRAYIVGAVGEAGENWVNQSQKQIAELCAAKYVYFETKRKSIAKNFIAMGWELRYGSKIKFYKLGRAL